MLYFGLFPVLFNASLISTTAARGALALSTLPLLTMLVGAALGSEALTARKSLGVLLAMFGVAIALLSGAPAGAFLAEAALGRADLRGADLGRAVLRWADLCGADLRGANLHQADLMGARHSSGTNAQVTASSAVTAVTTAR